MTSYDDKRKALDQYIKDNFTDYPTRKHKIAINKMLRAIDDSHLWPICNQFNTTNKAIRLYQRICNQYNQELSDCVYSYHAIIESFISEIVNDSNNW